MLLRSALDGHRDDGDGNGAEYLAVSAAAHCSACWAVLFNANALIATQIPRHKSGWALGDTGFTGAVSGACLARCWQVASWPTTWDCAPSSLATARYYLSVSLFTLFCPRKFCADRRERDARQRGVLLAAESQTGVQPVCDLADNPGLPVPLRRS